MTTQTHTLLQGVTVLDLTRLLPGPMATRHLADLGAHIIKIQAPEPSQADYAKTMGTAQEMDGDATYFYKHCNAGKVDLVLDLKDPQDKSQFLELVRTADVVIESFRPGVMYKLGLDFDTLKQFNSNISLVSVTGYGQTGQWALAAGHDINYMALSGQLHELCNAAGQINLPNVQYGDLLGGAMTAAFATVTAVLHSKLQGQGCWMDVSMTASLLAHNVMPLFAVQASGNVIPAGQALLNGGVPCYQVYQTQDARHLAVGALELKFWQTFCNAIGRNEWGQQHWSLGSHQPGDQASNNLTKEVAYLIANHPLAYWTELLKHTDCCVTPVLRLEEALNHAANLEFGTVGYRNTQLGRTIPTITAALTTR